MVQMYFSGDGCLFVGHRSDNQQPPASVEILRMDDETALFLSALEIKRRNWQR